MKTLTDKSISGLTSHGLSDYVLDSCRFDNCCIERQEKPGDRPVVRNVILCHCAQSACFLHAVAIEEVSLQDLKNIGRMPLFLWGCVFKHVELKGPIAGLKINRVLEPDGAKDQKNWDRDARLYYSKLDWALDISRAEFTGGVSLEAIPGSLIRRDPETQVLVTRQRLDQVDWKALDYGETAFATCLQWFLQDSQFDDVVLVAAKKSRKFRRELAVLQMLRNEGVAD
jgi:hypothetical protein